MFGRLFGYSTNRHQKKKSKKTNNKDDEKDECLSFVETSRNRTTMRAIRDMTDINPGFVTVRKLQAFGEYMKSKRENNKITSDAISSIKKDVRKNNKGTMFSDCEINKLLKGIDMMTDREDERVIFLEEITNSLGDFFTTTMVEDDHSCDSSDDDDDDDSADSRQSILRNMTRDARELSTSSSNLVTSLENEASLVEVVPKTREELLT